MLIKQWQDSQAARHTLADEWESQPLAPHVSVALDLPSSAVNRLVVVPKTMEVLFSAINPVACGCIKVSYPQLGAEQDPEEYDDEEQLYAAAAGSAASRRYPSQEFPIVKLAGSAVGIVVPRFANPVAELAVASEIARLAASHTKCTVLAPCQLNNGVSICQLDLPNTEAEGVPKLQPPHYITGIGAAVLTALESAENATALVLNAEGHPGFEKIDADSVMDAAEVLYSLLSPDEKAMWVQQLSHRVRKINSANTSGMYI